MTYFGVYLHYLVMIENIHFIAELIMILGIEVMFVVSRMSESPKESISLVYKFVSFFVALVFFFRV